MVADKLVVGPIDPVSAMTIDLIIGVNISPGCARKTFVLHRVNPCGRHKHVYLCLCRSSLNARVLLMPRFSDSDTGVLEFALILLALLFLLLYKKLVVPRVYVDLGIPMCLMRHTFVLLLLPHSSCLHERASRHTLSRHHVSSLAPS